MLPRTGRPSTRWARPLAASRTRFARRRSLNGRTEQAPATCASSNLPPGSNTLLPDDTACTGYEMSVAAMTCDSDGRARVRFGRSGGTAHWWYGA